MKRFLPILTFLVGCVLGGLVVWALLRSGQKSEEEAQRPNNANIAWGTPVNGLQAGISQEEGSDGTTIIGYHARNAGDKKLRILKLNVARGYVNTWLEVSVDGKPRPYSGDMIEPPPPPRVADFIYLPPGDSDALQRPFDPMKWKLRAGEKATLTFVFKNLLAEETELPPYDAKTKSGRKVTGLWVGTARSGSIEVVVK